jgi:hypothetical protein
MSNAPVWEGSVAVAVAMPMTTGSRRRKKKQRRLMVETATVMSAMWVI